MILETEKSETTKRPFEDTSNEIDPSFFEDLEEIPDFDDANEGAENDFDEDVIVLED